MLELRNISKRFGPVLALDDVSLTIRPGEVLGLLGENGAGKSTLMHVLFGLLRPDSGTISVQGREVRITSPRVAQGLSIGMVHQHFKLVPTLTAVENFSLFARRKKQILHQQAQAWLSRLRWQVPLEQPVGGLPLGQQQRVEIVKALLTLQATEKAEFKIENSTLILDEPTAVLTPQETSELFAAMREVRDQGAAIVFISHKLAEVQHVCDHVAILRRGKLVHAGPLSGTSQAEIAGKMIGSEMPAPAVRNRISRDRSSAGKPVLMLKNLSTGQLEQVSLELFPGEILGIAGVDGNGQSHLVQAILGTLPFRGILSGELSIAGQDAAGLSTRQRLDRIAFIAEDRQREALVLPLTIEENLMLKDYRGRRFSTLGWLRFRAWRSHAKSLIGEFDIRASSPTETAGHLSGGNQQKLVLARELYSADKSIILAVNPTRGLDIGATAFVLSRLVQAASRPEKPAAVLLIHSDLDELLSVSDRVAVLYNGRLTPTDWPETTKDVIGRLMLGLAV